MQKQSENLRAPGMKSEVGSRRVLLMFDSDRKKVCALRCSFKAVRFLREHIELFSGTQNSITENGSRN